MAAISTIIQICCGRLDGPRPKQAIALDMFGGYFEAWRLLDFIHDTSLDIRHLRSNGEIIERVKTGATDAMIIEPVAYDWEMTVFDHQAFVDSWMEYEGKRPRVLIFDTSLTGHKYRIDKLLTDLSDAPPWLIINIRSGLKLDQEGLELANVGIVDLYSLKEKSPSNLQELKKKLITARAVMGAGLGLNDSSALEAPWFLNRQRFKNYGEIIFRNNKLLARTINNTGGMFSRISHPALEKLHHLDWAIAPFVVFHLAEDSSGNHGFLVAVLVHEVKHRGLEFTLGSSFGFRGHRFEVIRSMAHLPPNSGQTGLLKVAMGLREGPSLEGVIDLLNEIAAYENFAALRAAYPHIKAYLKDSSGVYAERPPR